MANEQEKWEGLVDDIIEIYEKVKNISTDEDLEEIAGRRVTHHFRPLSKMSERVIQVTQKELDHQGLDELKEKLEEAVE